MNLLEVVKDHYNRKARLAPALIVLLPIVLVVLVLYPQLRTTAAGFASLLVSFGGLVLLTQLGRDRGKYIEARLFEHFGGKPSVALLRHRDTTFPILQKKRYHQFLESEAVLAPAPTAKEEASDGRTTDDWYETASNWLLGQTRDSKRFNLLFEENVNYGFRRNLYGLKPAAMVSGLAALSAGFIKVSLRYRSTGALPTDEMIAALVGVVLYLLAFMLLVRPRWVHLASVAYAQRLLEACDILPRSGNPAN